MERGAERLQSLDLVRGVAVMGILLLNIIGFAMPEAAYFNPRAYGGWHGADLGAYLVNFLLFDGRMRGLFAMLFGASMLLVAERAETKGESAAATHYSRMAWLLAFGLAHLWLVWDGDILAHYALVGMLAFSCRRLPVERLLVLGAMLAGLSTIVFAMLPIMAITLGGAPAADPAEAARNARELSVLVQAFGIPDSAELGRTLAHYRGGYAEILAQRLREHAGTPLRTLGLYGPETMAYMLFGMAALRSGLLRGRWPARRYLRWLLASWAVSLPVYLALAWYLLRAEFSLFAVTLCVMALAAAVRPLMVVGWACLILLLARPGGALTLRIAAAGRMAFTNYLATSLICTTLFYGYGLGLYGHLSRWQLYPIVALIWAAMLLWSAPWLARFRYGPLEWAWRSLARGRLQPMRGPAA